MAATWRRGASEEAELCRIWSEVLGAEQVGIHDNFFELGGDSILSLQVIARAARAGLKLTPTAGFRISDGGGVGDGGG